MELLRHEPNKLFHTVEIRPGRKLEINPFTPRAKYFEPNSTQWWRKGERPRRDSFRQRCYNAEDRFALKIEQRTFGNIAEVAKYTRDFMEKAWFQRRFPQFTKCVVEYRPGSSICKGGPRGYANASEDPKYKDVASGWMGFSSWGMGKTGCHRGGEVVVLHELAHAVLPAGHHHDRRWVRTFLEFIGCGMGQDTKRLLMEEFRREGVPYSPFKQVEFSEEHMQRLAAARPNPKKGGE